MKISRSIKAVFFCFLLIALLFPSGLIATANPDKVGLVSASNPGAPQIDLPVEDVDPPTGDFSTPSNGSTATTRTVNVKATASDNSGGLGVREVQFSAKWGDTWYVIGAAATPYSITWDMCDYNVPNGEIELGMKVIDLAGNMYEYSSNHTNPRFTKNYDCSGSLPTSNTWQVEAWKNKTMSGSPSLTETWEPFYIVKDWGTGAPYTGFDADGFSLKATRDITFQAGRYTFDILSDDGVKLLIDGQVKLDDWDDGTNTSSTKVDLTAGSHSVEIQYYDAAGVAKLNLFISGPGIARTEASEPTGKIALPADETYVRQNPLTLWADAWDDLAGVDYVKFKAYYCVAATCQWNDIGTAETPPYKRDGWDWAALDGQDVRFAIDVYDRVGKVKTDAGGIVDVTLDRTAPVAAIQSPKLGTVEGDKLVAITVDASDSISGVSKVKFYAGYEDGANNYWHVVGTDTTAADGWALKWDISALPKGKVVNLYVAAYDVAGNIGGSGLNEIVIGKFKQGMGSYFPVVQRPSPNMMVLIPAGEFVMGCDEYHNGGYACLEDNQPLHKVYLDAYLIDKYEVTNADYEACVEAGVCAPPAVSYSDTHADYYGSATYANYPVIQVAWESARTYCSWLGKRLPTEAEWEKAARGPTVRAFPWGDATADCTLGNLYFNRKCVGDTSKVGSYPDGGSPYGVMDMAGNVEEWVNDWWQWDYYEDTPYKNPQGPSKGTEKVVRGGCWTDTGNFLLTSSRVHATPGTRTSSWGFRCAAAVK